MDPTRQDVLPEGLLVASMIERSLWVSLALNAMFLVSPEVPVNRLPLADE